MFPTIISVLPSFDWQDLETLPRGLYRAKVVWEPSYNETPIYYSTGRNLPRNMGSLIDYGAGQYAWARSSFFHDAPITAQRATLELIGKLVLSYEVRELKAI